MPVILVNKAEDPKRIIVKKWRAKEEERHKGLLTQNIAQYVGRRKIAQSGPPVSFLQLFDNDVHKENGK
jgi:hypothetical protein